ncbi:uncharacterized protein ACR2FA_010612 [Aphomia sociella]
MQSEKIYYTEQNELQLDFVDSCEYLVRVDENNIVKAVYNSSEVPKTTRLDRSDNNTLIYCVKITCEIYKMKTNKCTRYVSEIRFLVEDPQTDKSHIGAIITGSVFGFVVLSVIMRIMYVRIRDYKIKQKNKTRPLPTIPIPREPVPYHHYEVIDVRFS